MVDFGWYHYSRYHYSMDFYPLMKSSFLPVLTTSFSNDTQVCTYVPHRRSTGFSSHPLVGISQYSLATRGHCEPAPLQSLLQVPPTTIDQFTAIIHSMNSHSPRGPFGPQNKRIQNRPSPDVIEEAYYCLHPYVVVMWTNQPSPASWKWK